MDDLFLDLLRSTQFCFSKSFWILSWKIHPICRVLSYSNLRCSIWCCEITKGQLQVRINKPISDCIMCMYSIYLYNYVYYIYMSVLICVQYEELSRYHFWQQFSSYFGVPSKLKPSQHGLFPSGMVKIRWSLGNTILACRTLSPSFLVPNFDPNGDKIYDFSGISTQYLS